MPSNRPESSLSHRQAEGASQAATATPKPRRTKRSSTPAAMARRSRLASLRRGWRPSAGFLTRVLIAVDVLDCLCLQFEQLRASLSGNSSLLGRTIARSSATANAILISSLRAGADSMGAADVLSGSPPQHRQCHYQTDNHDGNHYRPHAKPHVLSPARNDPVHHDNARWAPDRSPASPRHDRGSSPRGHRPRVGMR